jgi:DNA invertase Pin-like site-specific DNA recombinase
MQFALMEAVARQCSQSISDNVKRSIQSKLQKGEWIGKMPFGYKTVYSSSGQKSQVVDTKEGKIVTYIFETYANGEKSIASLSKKFDLSRSVISNILQNSFYFGEMFVKSQNKYYSHNYSVLIRKELFDQCQQKMQKR